MFYYVTLVLIVGSSLTHCSEPSQGSLKEQLRHRTDIATLYTAVEASGTMDTSDKAVFKALARIPDPQSLSEGIALKTIKMELLTLATQHYNKSYQRYSQYIRSICDREQQLGIMPDNAAAEVESGLKEMYRSAEEIRTLLQEWHIKIQIKKNDCCNLSPSLQRINNDVQSE